MKINYTFKSFNEHDPKGRWDQTLITDILGTHYFEENDNLTEGVVVIPASYHADKIDQINEYLNTLNWVILILTSDEESSFPVEAIDHPNISIYVQYPKVGRHERYNKLPAGYTPQARKDMEFVEKDLDFFFSGQNTHDRRKECIEVLRDLKQLGYKGHINATEGFTQGYGTREYIDYMRRAKVAPCPSGAISQDSFRVYEALESGCAPILDDESPSGDTGFWKLLYPDNYLMEYSGPIGLKTHLEVSVYGYPLITNEYVAWWVKQKRDIKQSIIQDAQTLSEQNYQDKMTIIIPSSIIPSHPDTRILEQTIESIRYHFPTEEIIITFDGVREEQKDRQSDYDKYIQKALFLCNTKWNAIPLIFNEHVHQIGMMKEALKHVKTPLVLYVEQDMPLVTDEPIEWDKINKFILDGHANTVRLHFEAFIPEPHKYLMIGEPENGFLRTIQWSQRPAVTLTDHYKFLVDNYFTENAKCFIEEVLHGKAQTEDWEIFKLWIYHPDGGNIKRAFTIDGREGTEKFESSQVF
jgi:hypothetical protein